MLKRLFSRETKNKILLPFLVVLMLLGSISVATLIEPKQVRAGDIPRPTPVGIDVTDQFPDKEFRKAILEAVYNNGPFPDPYYIDAADLVEFATLTQLDISGGLFSDIEGIHNFSSLTNLDISGNENINSLVPLAKYTLSQSLTVHAEECAVLYVDFVLPALMLIQAKDQVVAIPYYYDGTNYIIDLNPYLPPGATATITTLVPSMSYTISDNVLSATVLPTKLGYETTVMTSAPAVLYYSVIANLAPGYPVTFYDYNGIVIKRDCVIDGELAFSPPLPTRPNYTFDVWSPDIATTPITAPQDFVATYKINQYDVTFYDRPKDVPGVGDIHTETVNHGDSVQNLPSDIEDHLVIPPGYLFVGWDKSYGYVTGDLDIYPVFVPSPTDKMVVFQDWDGTYLKHQEVATGGSATPPSAPSRLDHTFTGWLPSYTNITHDTYCVAQYEINKYTVIFQYEDPATPGTFVTVSTQQIPRYGAASDPGDPGVSGYIFLGWDDGFSNVQKDLTITAHLLPDTGDYVVYVVNEGDGEYVYSVEVVTVPMTVTPPSGIPAPDTYDHIGWELSNGSYIDKTDTINYTSSTPSPLYAYAKYDLKEYTVTFKHEGVEIEVQKVKHGSSAVAPPIAYSHLHGGTVTNYFLGWNTSFGNVTSDLTVTAVCVSTPGPYVFIAFVDYDGRVIYYELVLPDEDLDDSHVPANPYRARFVFKEWEGSWKNIQQNTFIRAKYDPLMFTVRFFNNDNIQLGLDYYVSPGGEVSSPPSAPLVSGHIFLGWDTSFKNVWGNIDVYAKYAPEPSGDAPYVIFQDWDGRFISFEVVNSGENAPLPPDPARVGYIFDGWDPVNAWIDVTSPQTVKATYTVIEYKVRFFEEDGVTQIGSEQWVEHGKDADLPLIIPDVAGKIFVGWDKDYTNVTSDLDIIAVYKSGCDVVITVKLDDNPWLAHGKTINLHQAGTGIVYVTTVDSVYTEQMNGFVPEGKYYIYADGEYTGIDLNASTLTGSATINYYTVTYTVTDAGDASGSTIEAYYNSGYISSGDVVLAGGLLEFEVTPAGADTYTYTWTGPGTISTESTEIAAFYPVGEEVNVECVVTGSLNKDVVVTYNLNYSGSTSTTDNGTYGATLAAPSTPTRTGYIFGGWYKESGNTNPWYFTDGTNGVATVTGTAMELTIANGVIDGTPDAALTLYAKWTAKTVEVTYNLNYSGSTSTTDSGTYGATLAAPSTPTRAGYIFGGWYKESGNTNPWYFTGGTNGVPAVTGSAMELTVANGVTDGTPDATLTLYAKWTAKTVVVTYDLNYSGSTSTTDSGTYGATLAAPSTPTRAGYIFGGWYKERANTNPWYFSDGTNGVATVIGTAMELTVANGVTDGTPDATLTLYAKWTAKTVEVTYNLNYSGSTSTTDSGTYGATLAAPSTPTRTGYTFGGWYKESSNTNPWYFIGGTNGVATITGTAMELTVANGVTDGVGSANAYITLYAKWTPNPVDVTFDTNGDGAVAGTITSITRDYGLSLRYRITGATPTRFGYTFEGWATTANATVPNFFGRTPLTTANGVDASTNPATITLYAVWAPVSVVVTFDKNDTNAVSSWLTTTTRDYGTTLRWRANAAAPTLEGYIFQGWAITNNATTPDFFWNTPITQANGVIEDTSTQTPFLSLTLYAVWEPKVVEVTFQYNYGTAGVYTTDSSSVYDAKLTAPAVPSRTGYTFAGWYRDAGCTDVWDFANDDLTVANGVDASGNPATLELFAKWTLNPMYKVTYNGNGNTSGSAPVDNYTYVAGGTAIILGQGTLQKDGYTFLGWHTDPNATVSVYSPGYAHVMSSSIALYAVWQENDQYTVTVNGSYATTTGAGSYEQGANVTINAGTRDGYTFSGWTVTAGGVTLANAGSATTTFTMPANDVTVTANWTQVLYTVTVNSSYATTTGAGTYGQGTNVTINAGTRDGYTFSGWTVTAGGVTLASASSATTTFTMPANNVTVTANWTQNPAPTPTTYTVTYNGNGNSGGSAPVDSASPYTAGSTVTVIGNTGNLVKTGYTFLGWSTNQSATTAQYVAGSTFVINSNTTLYAVWQTETEVTYRVTYVGSGDTKGVAPIDPNSYHAGDTATVLGAGNLTRSNYAFLGWSTSANATTVEYKADDSITVNGNITLYAVWEADGNGNGENKNETPWALLNLVLCVIGGIVALAAIVMLFARKNTGTKVIGFLVAIAMGIAGVVLFFLTENMNNEMGWVDIWTIVNAIMLVIGVVGMLLAFKQNNGDRNIQSSR